MKPFSFSPYLACMRALGYILIASDENIWEFPQKMCFDL